MNSKLKTHLWTVARLLFVTAPLFTDLGCAWRPPEMDTRISKINYHGWTNSILLSNTRQDEVVIVPEIGRIMQFRLHGVGDVIWENEALRGRVPEWNEGDWRKTDWVNFGGDKAWPSPEGDWTKFTKRGWRPPPAFDGMQWESKIKREAVVMTSPVDPYYGIRVTRRVELNSTVPVLTVTTTYERVSGEPAKIGIWVITQFRDPVGVFVPVPENSRFTNGYLPMWDKSPPSLKVKNGWISLTRDPKTAYKIGTDASRVYWVGSNVVCWIDSAVVAGAEYPDQGSSLEVYTSPDPLPYVELETLGPLKLMKRGDTIKQTSVYRLTPRSRINAADEVRRLY